MSSDRYDLQRFVDAQDGTYEGAVSELRAGRKTSHWMWWVFPQIAGLGSSPTSVRYALSGLDEAQAYLAHPVLGNRLRECARTLLDLPGDDAEEVFGGVDAAKLRSSMTLFTATDPDEPTFSAVLEKYFGGERDAATTDRLSA
ncbi:DUF1810 family protein [Kineococcus sp. T13]|uniref:DUF1810 domain-containing protein n=1 Tax=Kineococcus vitellinus TaxID=2696565 RepID=UPI0014123F5F|nr:DUF1810 family protein [Kineococcus vitellinus]